MREKVRIYDNGIFRVSLYDYGNAVKSVFYVEKHGVLLRKQCKYIEIEMI